MKIWITPEKRILGTVAIIAVLLLVGGVFVTRDLSVAVFAVLAITVGPILGVTYGDGSMSFAVFYIVPLLASILLMTVGCIFRSRLLGQGAAVLGACGWMYCGVLALGAGA